MRERQRVTNHFVILVLFFSTLTMSCRALRDCRPGTLFVTTKLDDSLANANALEVRLLRNDHADDTPPPFSRRKTGAGTESIEIAFGTYTPGVSVRK